MTKTNKALIIGIIIVSLLVIWLADHLAQLQKNQRMADEISLLKAELVECTVKERDAAKAIERQNEAIEAIRIDTVIVEKRINSVIDKYAYVRETVRLSVEKDSSCENRLNNIDYVLRRFGGAELRSTGGD